MYTHTHTQTREALHSALQHSSCCAFLDLLSASAGPSVALTLALSARPLLLSIAVDSNGNSGSWRVPSSRKAANTNLRINRVRVLVYAMNLHCCGLAWFSLSRSLLLLRGWWTRDQWFAVAREQSGLQGGRKTATKRTPPKQSCLYFPLVFVFKYSLSDRGKNGHSFFSDLRLVQYVE